MLDILDTALPVNDQFNNIDLENIEPFTLVLLDATRQLFQLRWDGSQKSCTRKNESENHIWSSSTLYQPEHIRQRASWFEEWQRQDTQVDTKRILDFHTKGGGGDRDIDINMYRSTTKMQTVSVSHIAIDEHKRELHYFDLIQGGETIASF